MKLIFGMSLDEQPLPMPTGSSGGLTHCGPQGLLQTLETQLGLSGQPKDNDYLRIEEYRQALRLYLEQQPDTFFARAFAADQFATATNLLQRRDELLLAGWDFQLQLDTPPRLRALAEVEQCFTDGRLERSAGFADRFQLVHQKLGQRNITVTEIEHVEPAELLPPHYRRLLQQLSELGVRIHQRPERNISGDTDLARFQQALQQPGKAKVSIQGDGSLLLLRGQRDSSLAIYLAQLLRRTPSFRPAMLIEDKCQALGHALELEGLPSLGLLSASLARPTLQVLKLATVFLWKPIDPYKIMEFVSLSVKPLERELANRIAEVMAQTPGIDGDSWKRIIARYFDEVQDTPAYEKANDQYQFWFRRQRYDISGRVPKSEAIGVYDYLSVWAKRCFEDEGSQNNSLLILHQQARRIKEMLETLPEEWLSNLELERIVRTIYEPAPVQLRKRECGFLPYTGQAGAVCDSVPELVWWNFTQGETEHFFSRWYEPERHYLEQLRIPLQGPTAENQLQLWQRKRPMLNTTGRLVLIIPQFADGQERTPHPLMGDLDAKCEGLDRITFDADTTTTQPLFERLFQLPAHTELPLRQLGQPKPFIQICRHLDRLKQRETESFSSLRDLFYYPYQWVFRHKVRLRQTALLSIVQDHTLMGNLSHRFFERLLEQESIHRWTQEQVEAFIDAEAGKLLSEEGAVLLMYGREPERISFLQKIKRSAWSLIRHLQENGWEVEATEQGLEGEMFGLGIAGRADLLLKRGDERAVLDLKWRGARRREQLIRNEEDLQLVLYAKMAGAGQSWAHTAFFIMENGAVVARNNRAFQGINGVVPDADFVEVNQRILQRMEATFRWRMAQIERGQVEVRCAQTQAAIEEAYSEDPLLDILEMKDEDAPFDDYRALINLLQ